MPRNAVSDDPSAHTLTDRQIAGCFNRWMGRAYRVRLLGGAEEPVYLPPAPPAHERPAIIRYTRDYPASALHELAHWCIAGPERRARLDYGYWYQPPPRDAAARAAFVRAEIRVQALESRLAAICGLPFRVSLDDMSSPVALADTFSRQVSGAAAAMVESRLPPRARELMTLLRRLQGGLTAAVESAARETP